MTVVFFRRNSTQASQANQHGGTSDKNQIMTGIDNNQDRHTFSQYLVELVKRKPLRSSYFLRFGLAFFISLVSLLIVFLLPQSLRASASMPLFIITIALSSWYGGLLLGSCAAIVTSVIEFYIFFTPMHQISASIVPLIFFFVVGLIVNFLISSSPNNDQVQRLMVSEKFIAEKYTQKQQELENALKEIKARDEFLSIASHELKTPLTSMLLQLQIALNNIRTVSLANFSFGDLMNMLENAEAQINRLSKMINDLLNISLITTGRMTLEPTKMDLAQSVQLVFESFSERLLQENYQVDMALEENVIGVWDKIRIEQVITNLLSNAIKYGNHKPIMIKAYKDVTTAKLLIKDCGTGIAPAVQKRIFARFERASDDSSIKGLGVGLYITNQIVEAHGGKITVHSKPNEGASFIIELPLNQSLP